jgi:hypothetical protein
MSCTGPPFYELIIVIGAANLFILIVAGCKNTAVAVWVGVAISANGAGAAIDDEVVQNFLQTASRSWHGSYNCDSDHGCW